MISKSNIENMLKNGIVNVKFTKTDGSERLMKCTLSESLVKPYQKKTERTKIPNDNVIFAFDVEKQDWRSFKLDSILEVYK